VIRVLVHQSGGHIQRVHIRGHGSGVSGSDLVCAAVSAIAQTVLQGLLHHAGGEVRWRRRKGDLRIELPPSLEATGTGRSGERPADPPPPGGPDPRQVLLRTLVMGVQSIAREHPDRVLVRIREA
jgi:hypothetical protein